MVALQILVLSVLVRIRIPQQKGRHNADLKLYPHMRHEILNETDRQQVWDDVLAQIEQQ